MNRRRVIAILALGMVVAAGAAPAVVRQQERGPLVQWAGHKSDHPAGFVLITDAGAWRDLWASHTGVQGGQGAIGRYAAPLIDFQQAFVVAYFRGVTTNSDGEVLESADENPERLRLRFKRSTFQTMSMDGPDRGVTTSPFGMWLIAQPYAGLKKPIVVEEARQGMKREQVRYEEVHRFPAAGK